MEKPPIKLVKKTSPFSLRHYAIKNNTMNFKLYIVHYIIKT